MILGQSGGSGATCGARIARRPRCMCAIQTGMWAVTGYRYLSRGIQQTSCRTCFGSILTPESAFAPNIATRTASLGPDTPEIMGLNATHRNSAFSTRAGSGHQTGTKPPHLLGQKWSPPSHMDPNRWPEWLFGASEHFGFGGCLESMPTDRRFHRISWGFRIFWSYLSEN